jgi:cell division ATPase FtsA
MGKNINFENLSKFLDSNVYKIEKLAGKFIKNIFLIVKLDINLYTNICIKKNFYNSLIDQKSLKNILIDAKDLFKESYQQQSIMHMIINNYLINKKNYSSLRNDLKSDNLSLEIKFISIPGEIISKFVKILEKYQIRIDRTVCGHYVKNFYDNIDGELSVMADQIINGSNNNEVLLIPKNVENKGIFEKFFQIFS